MAGRKSTEADQRIAQKIRLLRQKQQVSQEQLAEVLGISFQQVQKYERGINRVSAGRLLEVAAALNVPIETFYEGVTVAKPDGAVPTSLDELKLTAEGLQLILAFTRIADDKKRKQILAFVRSVAG